MPKKYRVISQAAPVAGKTKLDVHKALLQMNIKPEQIQLLLFKPLVIKKGLENAAALELAERFSAAGLKVKIEAYEVAEPPAETSTAKQKDELHNMLLRTFAGPVQPAALEGSAQKGAASAVLAALVAPACYALLVLLCTSVLLWYVGGGYKSLFGALELPGALTALLWLFAFLLPVLLGMLVLIFLLYPLWPRAESAPALQLEYRKYARFHHMINQLTAAMDVAAPEFIEISPSAKVQVGPARGIFSAGKGDLRLNLGLGAVAGMNVQQLIGLLAQQFGHFSSRPTSAASIWISSIGQWLTHRAHERDEWDERLDLWHEAYEARVLRFGIAAIRASIGRARRLLAQLASLHRKVTAAKLREIEGNAFLYQARIIGSANVRAAHLLHQRLLSADKELQTINRLALYQREQLLRNLPAAIIDTHGESQADIHLEQIAPAEEARDPGMLTSDLPARDLLEDFDKLCEAATLHEYHRQSIFDAERFLVDNPVILLHKKELVAQARVKAIHGAQRVPINKDGTVDWKPGEPQS